MPTETPQPAPEQQGTAREAAFCTALSPTLNAYIEVSVHREFAHRNPPLYAEDRPQWEQRNSDMQAEARVLRRSLGGLVAEYLQHGCSGDPIEDEAFARISLEMMFKQRLPQTAEDHARAVMKHAKGEVLRRLRESSETRAAITGTREQSRDTLEGGASGT